MENLLSEMEWGEDNIFKLISLYREQQVLWNQTIPDYQNKNMKNYAWNYISREINLSKAEVQNKMRNLIIQFNREAKKGNKSGSGADDGKTKWKFFQSMMFLKDKTIPRQARETAGEQDAVGPQGEAEEENENNELLDDSTEAQNDPATNTTLPTTPVLAPKQATYKRKRSAMVEEAYAVMKNLGSNIKIKDDCDVFGENVSCQLRQITDARLRIIAKHRINEILFEMGMSQFNNPHTSSSSTPSTSRSETPNFAITRSPSPSFNSRPHSNESSITQYSGNSYLPSFHTPRPSSSFSNFELKEPPRPSSTPSFGTEVGKSVRILENMLDVDR